MGRRADVANVAELVYALDLGSSGATHESSSLSVRTTAARSASVTRALRPTPRNADRHAFATVIAAARTTGCTA